MPNLLQCECCGLTEPADETDNFGQTLTVRYGPKSITLTPCKPSCASMILADLKKYVDVNAQGDTFNFARKR